MNLQNSYSGLPATLYTRVDPTAVAAPQLIQFNAPLAADLQLDLDPADSQRLAQLFSGNERLPGSEPIALAYAGHQFGNFVPRLGDGRAVLLGEATDRRGILRDIQLKGSGRTPYSRGGDGRAALGPVLREYLVSEAMTALGIPSTRSLAAVLTGEPVYRQGPLPGAIVTRVASSHVRVGTFQYLAARNEVEALTKLADYLIDRHYPEVNHTAARYLEFLNGVVARQASLIARWMHVGFIHGVMNTDNTSIAGETIDFGPCAFLDSYDPQTVFSSIDHQGRYAFANQPAIAQWNMARFAEHSCRSSRPIGSGPSAWPPIRSTPSRSYLRTHGWKACERSWDWRPHEAPTPRWWPGCCLCCTKRMRTTRGRSAACVRTGNQCRRRRAAGSCRGLSSMRGWPNGVSAAPMNRCCHRSEPGGCGR